MAKIEYGFRPSVLFKKGTRNKRNNNGSGSVVAIIGAFPCVSEEILHFTDLEEARTKLKIKVGVHDKQFTRNSDGDLVVNQNYYYGAGALKQVFLDKTPYNGASEVIICNISTYLRKEDGDYDCYSGGARKINKTLIHNNFELDPQYLIHNEYGLDKLTVALYKLKKEKFNNLVLAFPLDEISGYLDKAVDSGDTQIEGILKRFRNWTRETYTVQHPCICYFGLTQKPSKIKYNVQTGTDPQTNEPIIEQRQVSPSVIDSIVDANYSTLIDTQTVKGYLDIFSDEQEDAHSLGALFAEGVFDETEGYILNPVETAAQYAGYVAGTPVDQSLTQTVIPTVKGTGLAKQRVNDANKYKDVFEELNYDPDVELNTDGYTLVKAGATMFECTNRNTKEYSVVSSTLPCGYDISHIRTSAYIIEQIVLNPFLGKINNDTSLQAIDSVITSIKNTMVERFPIVESIEHSVEKVTEYQGKPTSTCIKIRVHINFYGIIINEIVYMSMSVENQNRMVGNTEVNNYG